MFLDPRDPWLVIFRSLSYLSLVLCCDIYRSTLILIMYPACMITIHDRKSRVLQSLILKHAEICKPCQTCIGTQGVELLLYAGSRHEILAWKCHGL